MEYPKLVIASDGHRTVVLLDGVLLGRGIGRVDFSSEDKNGEMKPTIHFLDVDVAAAKVDKTPDLEQVLSILAEE